MKTPKIAVSLEGQDKDDIYPHDVVLPDLSCLEQLLVELMNWNPVAFESAFKCKETGALLKRWKQSRTPAHELVSAIHDLRKSAFEAEHCGEVAVLLKNQDRMPDVQPNIPITLARIPIPPVAANKMAPWTATRTC